MFHLTNYRTNHIARVALFFIIPFFLIIDNALCLYYEKMSGKRKIMKICICVYCQYLCVSGMSMFMPVKA